MSNSASTLETLLEDCDARDIRLIPAGDGGLTIDAPRGALTPALIGQLKAHKSQLLAILRGDAEPGDSGPDAVAGGKPLAQLDGDETFRPFAYRPALETVRYLTPDEVADIEAKLIQPAGNGDPWESAVEPPSPCPVCRGIMVRWDVDCGIYCTCCEPGQSSKVLAGAERVRQRHGAAVADAESLAAANQDADGTIDETNNPGKQ